MPNPTSSSESGIPTGSDLSRCPPSWAGLRPDAGIAHQPRCKSVRDMPHMSGLGETLVHSYGRRDETRGQARQKAPWIVVLHAVVEETRGKQADLPQE